MPSLPDELFTERQDSLHLIRNREMARILCRILSLQRNFPVPTILLALLLLVGCVNGGVLREFVCSKDHALYYDVGFSVISTNASEGVLTSSARSAANCLWTVGGRATITRLYDISFTAETSTLSLLAVYGAGDN